MLKKILLSVLAIVLVGAAVLWFNYNTARDQRLQALDIGSKIADTAAGPIEYLLQGDEGPVILYLHGTPGGYDQTPETIAGYRWLIPSRPGYLRTALTVGVTPAEQAIAVAALLDVLGIDRVFVMGASGGGPSAISFAAMFEKRTIGLIAIEVVAQSIPGSVSTMPSDPMIWLGLNAVLGFGGPEALVEMMIPDPDNQRRITQHPERMNSMTAMIWSIWPTSGRRQGMVNDNLQFQNLTLPLADIRVPTLILHGTADVSVPYAHAQILANTIPDATLHTIEGGDHMMPFTHPEEMKAALGAFLQRLSVEDVANGVPKSVNTR